jgi:hypothetical protein
MAGQIVHDRLVHDQEEIRKAPRGKDRTAAYGALKNTETAWEMYDVRPTAENWNNLQTVGSTLDVALRKLRDEQR